MHFINEFLHVFNETYICSFVSHMWLYSIPRLQVCGNLQLCLMPHYSCKHNLKLSFTPNLQPKNQMVVSNKLVLFPFNSIMMTIFLYIEQHK